MNEAPKIAPEQQRPQAKVKERMHFSPVWLVPILVGVVAIYVGYDTVRRHGKTITVSFASADGLVPGETPVRYKNVQLGTVEDVRLTPDMSHVEAKVRIQTGGRRLLTDHARFWVVRPRFNGSVSTLTAGLETLVSGAYIAVDPGLPGGQETESYVGLEEPPGVRSDEPGRVFVIHADKLGSLGSGSPVYFHGVVVGEVLKGDIGDGRSKVNLRVFIRAPFDKYVYVKTHFWDVSGLSVNMGPDGLHLEVQSVQAVIAGGIAFDLPREPPTKAAPDNTTFSLFENKAAADAAAYELNIGCVSYYKTSVQGLSAGAVVQVLGTPVGLVKEVKVIPDAKRAGGWLARVVFELQPERIAQGPEQALTAESLRAHPPRVFLDSVSMLTGQKVISLDFSSPHPPRPDEVTLEGDLVVLPGETGGLDNIAVALGHVAGKLEQIPFDEIGKNLDLTLRSVQQTVGGQDMQNAVHQLSVTMTDVHHLVQQADQGLTPSLARLPAIADQLQAAIANANHAFGEAGYGADSDFQRNAARLMTQISEAARSIRLLADFLDRHPDALIRGKSGGEK